MVMGEPQNSRDGALKLQHQQPSKQLICDSMLLKPQYEGCLHAWQQPAVYSSKDFFEDNPRLVSR